MQTVQIVLDENLLALTDAAARRAELNRSALVREALRLYLRRQAVADLEARDRQGYAELPPGDVLEDFDEVAAWPSE
jgi:metal-responsive CopG/Arc/MetJ family transcriptional regulator